jgi:hypothetical protein
MALRKNTNGSVAALAALTAAGIVIFITSLSVMTRVNTKQTNYLKLIDRSIRLAETSMNNAMGKVVINPELVGLSPISDTIDGGKTEVFTQYVDTTKFGPCLYLLTVSTRTVGKNQYITNLHTYAKVSNVSSYFAAIRFDTLEINPGVQAPDAKVVSENISFNYSTDPGRHIELGSVEYISSISPATTSTEYDPAGSIRIQDNSGLPKQISDNSLLFPQILDADMDRLKQIARLTEATHIHRECDFRTRTRTGVGNNEIHIFPPGYIGTQHNDAGTSIVDTYADWRANNSDHVYYCDDPGGMNIQGVIHGQVLFVSEGPIIISSSVMTASTYYQLRGVSYTPDPFLSGPQGGLNVTSSTANQPIFITRGSIRFTSTFYSGPVPPITPLEVSTQTIQGLFMAPYGEIILDVYGPAPFGFAAIHEKLSLDFQGSIILQKQPQFRRTFNSVDAGNGFNRYSFMTSLSSHPPPYVPALTKIVGIFEDITLLEK